MEEIGEVIAFVFWTWFSLILSLPVSLLFKTTVEGTYGFICIGGIIFYNLCVVLDKHIHKNTKEKSQREYKIKAENKRYEGKL